MWKKCADIYFVCRRRIILVIDSSKEKELGSAISGNKSKVSSKADFDKDTTDKFLELFEDEVVDDEVVEKEKESYCKGESCLRCHFPRVYCLPTITGADYKFKVKGLGIRANAPLTAECVAWYVQIMCVR